MEILSTKKMAGGIIAHKVSDISNLKIGATFKIQVNEDVRYETAKHHSATHLLQAALQRIVGNHISQKGSKVESTKLTFDFSHNKSLTTEQIRAVEEDINSKISQGLAVQCKTMSKEEAEKIGATALFGEKYGETVRVIQMGDKTPVSIELCGGTHVSNTANIGMFKIISESSVASGVRRIEAVAGKSAWNFINTKQDTLEKIAEISKANAVKNDPEGFVKIISNLVETNKNYAREIEKLQIEICILNKIERDGIIYLYGENANVVRESVIKIIKDYKDKIAVGIAKNQDNATYVIDSGTDANKTKTASIASSIQDNASVTNKKDFSNKMLIFGGKYINNLHRT